MNIHQAIERLEHLRDEFKRPYRITCTNGNDRNGIKGSRIGVHNGDESHYLDIPRRNGWKYVKDYPGGKYARKAAELIEWVLG